jgi:hypothetical protein
LDKKAKTIEYTTTKQIDIGDELCIYYGSDDKLWFPMQGDSAIHPRSSPHEESEPLPFGLPVDIEDDSMNGTLKNNPMAPITTKPLFEIVKMLSQEEQEEATGMPITTSMSAVISLTTTSNSEAKSSRCLGCGCNNIIASEVAYEVCLSVLNYDQNLAYTSSIIKKNGFDTDELKHLKRVRTIDGKVYRTLLVI